MSQAQKRQSGDTKRYWATAMSRESSSSDDVSEYESVLDSEVESQSQS